MDRLHPDRLASMAAVIRTPAYDREALACGIVHLGLGAFHRAHQAVYTEQAMEVAGGDWGIIGVSLRSDTVARQLQPQDGLYSVLSEDGVDSQLRLVGAIRQVLVAPQEPQRVVAAIADAAVAIVTLTITEKGYCLDDDGQSLAVNSAEIARDLANPERPTTALGLLALGLRERMASGGAALTLLSCDNLAENSRLLRTVLLQYLENSFPAVIPWLNLAVSFPCSMVDRIVPAMTAEARHRQALLLGLEDEGAVATEQFHQWIIEDDFAGPRPAWEQAGVQLVANVVPYENIKLRLLNASHSAIAFLGLLSGQETVDAVVNDEALRGFVHGLMTEELMPALVVPAGFDLVAYRDQLLQRFANPRLKHRCAQIAMDSSEKISQRWLATLATSAATPLLGKALALWCQLVLSTDVVLDDPRAEELLQWRNSAAADNERIAGVLACARITRDSVPRYPELVDEVQDNMNILGSAGVTGLLAA